ncbi:MAG: hypothetical protein CUR33_09180 [Pseudomonas sp.]|uniref:hypothetical protein n=1 Tax=Pseudomonas sp. FEMGT703P TaxID=2080764 RepID=UPI000CADC89A|nr:hypothetical protein [Pseudomonas sp. FEMGT703P]PJE43438.1 MAG: hypothetical protein CUR33_09180 [Pseudomonas sp.] [Pseudomonas sp. FEMGT703P]
MSRQSLTLLSLLALVFYIATLAYAAWIADTVPLFIALRGAGLMDIAHSRSQFLAGLVGYESLLRYSAFMLGRSVMPLILVAAFMLKARFRYWLLVLLLVLSMLAMEKAAPIFVLLPLAFYYVMVCRWKAVFMTASIMLGCVLALAFLAGGGNSRSSVDSVSVAATDDSSQVLIVPPGMPIQEAMGDPSRALLPYYLCKHFSDEQYQFDPNKLSAKFTLLLNRVGWVPYITAYDWLEFQRIVLEDRLTLGRSISFVHLLFGEPKMQLEKMVYVYEYGASPGGQGASNTVFFVDAKLAFGWVGVIVYCLVFTFFAACIFTSGSQVLIVSSIVCFIIASVSSLTATLLSGGLFIYFVLSLFLGEDEGAALLCKDFPK